APWSTAGIEGGGGGSRATGNGPRSPSLRQRKRTTVTGCVRPSRAGTSGSGRDGGACASSELNRTRRGDENHPPAFPWRFHSRLGRPGGRNGERRWTALPSGRGLHRGAGI